MRYNSAASTFTFTYNNVAYQGQYTISITCTDGIDNRVASTSYILNVGYNSPP